MIGIYKIKNINNGKCYIGQSTNIKSRWSQHRNMLENNKHHSVKLQEAWNYYGCKSFKFEVLEECKTHDLYFLESKYIDKYNSMLDGYNMNRFEIKESKQEKIEMLEKNELESWLFSVPKKSPLGDLVYKSKQLSGLDIFDKSKSSIKNMTDYHHKIINVFLQRVHNSLYDRKNIYKRVDMFQDEVYFKIGYKLLIDKMGLNVDGKQFKDLRYLESQIESLSGIFMKIRDNSTIDSFPIFSNILIDRDEEELYFAFNKEIIKAIVNNNRRIDCEDGSSPSYITLNITDLHTKNLSQSAMMLYEFLLTNITNVTVNLNRYPIDEITSYISNRTNIKPSQVLEKIIIPSIQEIEDKLNLTVFYMCETYIKRNKLKNIAFKVYTNDKYVPYEKSNKDEDGFEFINLDDLTTANIFRISSDEYKHCLENGLTNYDYKFVSEEYFGELVDWNMNHVEFRNNIIINKLMELIDRDNKVDMIDKFMKNDNYERYCSALNKFNLIPISKEMFDKGYRY